MKIKLCFLVLFAINFYTYGQKVNYDRIIPPEYSPELKFEEKLVYLAWQNQPVNKILNHRVAIAEKNKKKADWAWLEIFSASGNLNEFTINQNGNDDLNNRAQFYPRYNFGARINMDMFVTIPSDIKIAKEEIGIANSTIDAQKINLRAEVLRAYQVYLMNMEVLSIQTESTEGAYSDFLLNEQKFKNGEIDLEEYSSASQRYNEARRAKLDAETNFNIAKINIEELIGITLEDVK